MRTTTIPSELSAADLIKYLNGRKNWHGKQYRSLCGEWLRKAEIKKQALRELADKWEEDGFGSVAAVIRDLPRDATVEQPERDLKS